MQWLYNAFRLFYSTISYVTVLVTLSDGLKCEVCTSFTHPDKCTDPYTGNFPVFCLSGSCIKYKYVDNDGFTFSKFTVTMLHSDIYDVTTSQCNIPTAAAHWLFLAIVGLRIAGHTAHLCCCKLKKIGIILILLHPDFGCNGGLFSRN